MERKTHPLASESFCGKVLKIEDGYSEVELETCDEMKVDSRGLVHGGFTFSVADLSAMVAVNHPLVVLAGAEVKFLKPVVVGDKLIAKAKVVEKDNEKRRYIVQVDVEKKGQNEKVFEGKFFCVVPRKHVLDR